MASLDGEQIGEVERGTKDKCSSWEKLRDLWLEGFRFVVVVVLVVVILRPCKESAKDKASQRNS